MTAEYRPGYLALYESGDLEARVEALATLRLTSHRGLLPCLERCIQGGYDDSDSWSIKKQCSLALGRFD